MARPLVTGQPLAPEARRLVKEQRFMRTERTPLLCANCGGRLGRRAVNDLCSGCRAEMTTTNTKEQ